MRARVALASALGAIFAIASASVAVSDPQAFTAIALGREAIASGPARVETLSWTAAGTPLLGDEWLAQILFALAYEGAGWKGVVVLRALAGGALIAITAFAALGERARPLAAVIATLPAALLLSAVWTERPQLLALVLFAGLIALLRGALAGRPGLLWACVPLFVVWANVHASYAAGLIVFAVAALGIRRREALLALLAGAAATLLTPGGASLPGVAAGRLLAPPRYVPDGAVPDLVTPAGLVLALTLASVLAVALLGRAARRDALILVPVAFVALTTASNAVLLAVAAAPFLAANAPAAIRALALDAGVHLPALVPSGLTRSASGAATAIAALSLAAIAYVAPAAPDLRAYPQAALPALRAGPGLFNELDWGGFVTWHAPGTKVFIDARLWPYVPTVRDDHTTIKEAHPGWRETIARLGVRQLLVRPTAAVAVRARELGWQESASGPGFVLFEVPR